MTPVKPQKITRTLTDEEQKLQMERGLYHRKLMREIIGEMIDAVDKNKVGLLISGGVDSTTILWQLLELGVRPRLYTIEIPTAKVDSADTAKAKKLAERYSLPLNVVTMPKDPDELFKMIDYINNNYDVVSRADFEVVTMYQYLVEAARDEGCTSVFSGIADEAIHVLGREKEIRARNGKMGQSEINYLRMYTCGVKQTKILMQQASHIGVSLCLPLAPLAHCQPYFDIPWKVTNVPRVKAITINAWEKEEKESGIRVVVNPMQCGDSGSREYHDNAARTSPYIIDKMNKTPNSAQMVYNYMKRIKHGGSLPKGTPQPSLDWYGYVTENIEVSDDIFHPSNDEGYAKHPSEFAGYEGYSDSDTPVDEESMFDDLGEVEEDTEGDLILNDDGTVDNRIDCFGFPFWMPGAETTCERARAGLCGKFQPDHPHRVEKCSIWLDYMEQNREYMKELAMYASSQLRPFYERWADIAYDLCDQIRRGTREFK